MTPFDSSVFKIFLVGKIKHKMFPINSRDVYLNNFAKQNMVITALVDIDIILFNIIFYFA